MRNNKSMSEIRKQMLLDEKAVSQQQQKIMGLALAYKRGDADDVSDEVKKIANSMSTKELEKFAGTKHDELPVRKEETELKENPEDEAPASPDEGHMAVQQLEFMMHAVSRMKGHIERGGKFPEWMQNKLSGAHEKLKGLYSNIEHEMGESLEESRYAVKAGKHAIGSASYDDKEIITVTPQQAKKLTAYFQKTKDGDTWKKLFQGGGRGGKGAESQKEFDSMVAGLKESAELEEVTNAQIHKVLGPTKNAVQGIAALKKAFKVDDKEAKAMLKRVMSEESDELDEAKSSTGYELHHKDFSSAMQHAYAFAKKKFGITIDPKEIDDKVATGPRKPSSGKTNTYRLKGDKGTIQVQVANLDNKRFELNMYKESLDEGRKSNYDFSEPDDSGADKAVIMQIRKAYDLEGKFDVEFADGKTAKVSKPIAKAVMQVHMGLKPKERLKFQKDISKSYKNLLTTLKKQMGK